MKNRELITLEEKNFILKEAYIDSSGDIVWDIKDKKTQNSFIVHSSSLGRIYITFFKKSYITKNCSKSAIKKICEILLERNFTPTIKIRPTNNSLIELCRSIGFRKYKTSKHLYYFNNLK